MAQARAEHKNILMDVGGNWCPWCILVDRTLHEDAELKALLEKNYVLLHVDFSQGHENTEFLKHYPKATGISGVVCVVSGREGVEGRRHQRAGADAQAWMRGTTATR